MPVGDFDKRITILTKERGKITAFARRKTSKQPAYGGEAIHFRSVSLSCLRVKAHILFKGHNQQLFQRADTGFGSSIHRFYFLEFCGYFCQENNDEKDMLKLLYQSLRALESPAYKMSLVRAVFELKAITINGEGPSLFRVYTVIQGKDLMSFGKARRVFCDNCGKQVQGRHILSDTLYTMQYIVSADITKLYTFAVSDDVL